MAKETKTNPTESQEVNPVTQDTAAAAAATQEATEAVDFDRMFNFQEVNIGVEDVIKFEIPGDIAVGYVRKLSSMNTKKGKSEFIEMNTLDAKGNVIMNPETGDPLKTTVFLSAGLVNYPWEEFINRVVKIEYTGEQFNPRSGQTFKCFKVQVSKK